MKELVELITRSLVDHPEQIAIDEIDGEEATVYELRVAGEDLGKVIGKQGRTARAIRTILSTAAAKQQRRVVLEIVE
jgi:predicted RNA-binding protein YlqC (UPF0109 family)